MCPYSGVQSEAVQSVSDNKLKGFYLGKQDGERFRDVPDLQ